APARASARARPGRGTWHGRGRRPRSLRGRPRPLLVGQLPAAAERLVEADHRGELRLLGLGELGFGRIELLLRLQHLEVARPAAAIAFGGEVDGTAERQDLALQSGAPACEMLLRGERVGGLAEGGEDGLAIAR